MNNNRNPLLIASSPLRSNRVSFDCVHGQSNEKLKQVDIDYKFVIEGFVAYHSLAIRYKAEDTDVQAVFRFALTEDACFDGLSVTKGAEVIVCVVKEKEEAKKEYTEAVQLGKGAAFGGLEKGMMSVQIGNITKQEVFTVQFKYIQLMNSKDQSLKQLQMILPIRGAESVRLSGEIRSQNEKQDILELKFFNFPKTLPTTKKVSSHETSVNPIDLGQIDETPSDEYSPMICVKYSDTSMSVLSSFQNDSEISPYCCLLTCPNPILENSKKITNTDGKSDLIPSDFVILLDRSGSMSGIKIQMAVEALIFFLKSLPEGSIYNIVSFGSTFEFLHEQSLQVNDDNMQQSISKIEAFRADLGGTNIIGALQHLFTEVQDQIGLRRKIFIMTDGEFDNKNAVTEEIERNKHGIDLQVLGIGSDVDRINLEKLVKITKGTFQLVTQPQQITSAVIHLLQDSFSCQTQVSLSLDISAPECLNFIVPNPQLIRYIDPTKPLQFFLFLNRKFEETQQLTVSLSGTPKSHFTSDAWDINIKNAIPQARAPIHKIGLYQLIRNAILAKKRKTSNILDDLACAIQNAPSNCLELLKNEAIRYQILCEYTAFVGVSEEPVKTSPYQTTCSYGGGVARKKATIGCDFDDINQYRFNSLQSVRSGSINLQMAQRKDSAGCCSGGSGTSYSSSSSSTKQKQANQNFRLGSEYGLDDQKSQNSFSSSNQLDMSKEDIYQRIIKAQRVNGSWKQDEKFLKYFQLEVVEFNNSNPIEPSAPNRDDIWFTIFVVHWIQKACSHHLDIHQFIVLKAYGYIDRLAKQYDIPKSEKLLDDLMAKGGK